MTEIEHAGGIVTSSKVPALHLIPTEALLCLADRFEVGTKRKGDGAWNALTKNQECLDDNAFLIERCSHIIRHTMMLRDQLAHGYNSDDEDTPYENAGAIIFGGALMACAMARRGECITCGLCFTESGQVACRDCLAYAYEATGCPMEAAPDPVESPDDWVELPPDHVFRKGVDQFSMGQGDDLTWIAVDKLEGSKVSDWPEDKARCRRKDLPVPTPAESPDDWVVQDRVPARETDRGAWLDNGEDYPPYDFQSRHWWTVRGTKALGFEAGSVDAVGRTLHLICRRKDLPAVGEPKQVPPEDEYVVQDTVDPRVGIDEFRWVSDGYSQPWKTVESHHNFDERHGFFDESDGTTLEIRCLKKDLPVRIDHHTASLIANHFYECRNGKVVGPMEYNRNHGYFFTKDTNEVGWNHIGQAVRICLDVTDEELKGWSIDLCGGTKCPDGTA